MTTVRQIDAAWVERHLLELATHGAVGTTGVNRVVYSDAWVAAQALVQKWCREADLKVHVDSVGNVWGRLEGTESGPSIVTGSHIDSQTPGGRYDGALGVVGGVLALRALNEQFGRPRRTVEVVSLCEEEDVRFAADFWASRAITGRINPDEPDFIRDSDGISIADAMRYVGLDPARLRESARLDIDTFIELHIEQGPTLDDAKIPVAVVTAITGIRHYWVELIGRADHAGARPMSSRLDAIACAAEIVTAVIEDAERMGPPAVTTVGKMFIEPNLASTVPARAKFAIDVRHPDPDAFGALCLHHENVIRSICQRRGLAVTLQVTHHHEPCPCAPEVVRAIESQARALGIPFLSIHSGGGHDGQVMAQVAKIGMIFVRSVDGRSHAPEEFTTAEDAAVGVTLLASTVHELAY